jgi:hypothetical protein
MNEVVGPAHHGEGHPRKLVLQQRPHALGEKAEGGDVREMLEGADEKQALAGRFRVRLEARQVHSVFDHLDADPRPQ